MPRHKQVTTCRKSDGPTSKSCNCEHCQLAVCGVCGAAEGTLTTDCPGTKVDHDRQQEVFETNLDYNDDRGWHLAQIDARTLAGRTPRFEATKVPPEPPRVDSRTIVAPQIDWATVDRNANLQHELAQKAIAWVLADRTCEDHSAAIVRLKDEAALLREKTELLAKLERENIDFHLADQRAQKCDDEFRQAARKLVAALEPCLSACHPTRTK